jgi:integrase
MIGRRKRPDGLPFRLYPNYGKHKVSFGYKLPNGKWAFRLSASSHNKEAIADIRKQAIERAEALNGDAIEPGTVEALIEHYFEWQENMPRTDERRKAQSTLDENRVEAKRLEKVFGKMSPKAIRPKHVYGYLDKRAQLGAPAKANKEIALLSAVLEYGRRRGEIEINPCRGIEYNPTRPRTRYVHPHEIALAVEVARSRKSVGDKHPSSTYLILALCVQTAYLTVSRPTEMRELHRQSIGAEGITVPIGKRKAGEQARSKLVLWSPELRAVIEEALALQRTTSLYVFGNTAGQVYTRSGWNTSWSRLMDYCEVEAKLRGVKFERFSLRDMRPAAVTDRKEEGDDRIIDATGHSDERMVNKTYDRRRARKVRATR